MPHRRIVEVIEGRPFPTVHPTTTVRAAALIMREWHASAILVVVNKKLLGILTERDIVFRVVAAQADPATMLVSTVMTADPITIHQDKPFGHALHLMYEGGFRHVPVVDDRGHAVGLLAAQDALDMDALQMEQELVRREEITVIL